MDYFRLPIVSQGSNAAATLTSIIETKRCSEMFTEMLAPGPPPRGRRGLGLAPSLVGGGRRQRPDDPGRRAREDGERRDDDVVGHDRVRRDDLRRSDPYRNARPSPRGRGVDARRSP